MLCLNNLHSHVLEISDGTHMLNEVGINSHLFPHTHACMKTTPGISLNGVHIEMAKVFYSLTSLFSRCVSPIIELVCSYNNLNQLRVHCKATLKNIHQHVNMLLPGTVYSIKVTRQQ